jgi:hypothetical protein
MATESGSRSCPYCKEEIKEDATRCKHCRSSVAPEKPAHQGTCPYCKEAIHAEAIKCKHCGASVGPADDGKCCEGCAESPATRQIPAGFTQEFSAASSAGEVGIGPGGSLSPVHHQSFCTGCQEEHSWHPVSGQHYGAKVRHCSAKIPFAGPDGRIYYKTITWTERCDNEVKAYLYD